MATRASAARPRLAQRVLVIGWDAADWRIIGPLMERGQMPALSRLVEAGTHGNLATLQPALSPMLWTSIATGKRADKHGIHGFLEPIPDGSGVRPVSSTSRRCKALWNIAHQNDLRSLVVSWYASHPAEPIRGAVVSDRFIAGGRRDMPGGVSPEAMRQGLADGLVAAGEITPGDLAHFIPQIGGAQPEDARAIQALAHVLARGASVQASATRLMLGQPWDLAMVFFDGLDHLGHWFMPYHPPHRPGVCERRFELFKDVITGGYRFFDMMLESLLAHAGGDTTVILVSDHGFKSDALRPRGSGWENPVDWHRGLGVAVASGPGVKRGERLFGATVLDVAPTALHLLGLPVGMDADGRPWLEALTPAVPADSVVSWERVEGDAGLHATELREDPADAVAAIQQLVDLGYMAPLSDDAATTIRQTLRDNRINLVLSMFGGRRVGQARGLVDELLHDYPDDVLILGIASRLALIEGRAAEACRLAERASEEGGRTPTVVMLLAEAAALEHDDDRAVSLYREATLLERAETPRATTFGRLGDALARLGDAAAAQAAYRDGLAVDPDHAPLWVGLAKLALRADDAPSAVEYAMHAAGLLHTYPEAHLRLGEALAMAGREEDAVVALGVCLSMSPGTRPCVELMAKLKKKLGHADASFYAIRAKSLRTHRERPGRPGRGRHRAMEAVHAGQR